MTKLIFTTLCIAFSAQMSFAQLDAGPFNGVAKLPDSLAVSSNFGGAGGGCGDIITDSSTPILVMTPGTGYATGNNSFGDREMLQKYDIDSIGGITGIIAYIPIAMGSSSDSAYGVLYNVDPVTHGPGSIVYKTLPLGLDSLSKNTIAPDFSYFTFDVSPIVDDSFFVGIILPQKSSGDTIVCSSTTDNCSSGADLAWERRSNGSFHPMSDPSGKNLNIDFCIFPVFNFNGSVVSNKSKTNLSLINAAYPNPASGMVDIKYSIEHSSDVRVEFFDIMGRMTLARQLGVQTEGQHTVNIDISSMSAGNYFYTITTESTRFFNKINVQ